MVAAERANVKLGSLKHDLEVRWLDVVEFVEETARSDDVETRRELEERAPAKPMLSWSYAIEVIRDVLAISPHLPNGG